ncbi:unnamed protein product [Toxocara canis]|uniref:Ovule protein n=1 Tax=Toxocara canis TaxID=6265 RepID=A0A183TVK0_TOXCA|nr:unnamed protein product [Toxocara canis]
MENVNETKNEKREIAFASAAADLRVCISMVAGQAEGCHSYVHSPCAHVMRPVLLWGYSLNANVLKSYSITTM